VRSDSLSKGIIALLAIALSSCASLLDFRGRVELRDDLEALDVPYKQGDALEEAYRGRDYLLIGETHYVAEHQAFWSARFGSLADSGYRVFAQEGQIAFSWLVEAYSLGEELAVGPEELIMAAEEVYGFDGAWLRHAREANSSRPEDGRIAFAYFDMNHWPYSFVKSVSIMLRAAGRPAADAPGWLRELLLLRPGTPEYLSAIEAAIDRAGDGPAGLGLGAPWDARLARMLRDELESARLRARWNDGRREDFIEGAVLGLRRQYGNGPIAVNCGMNHAQLRTLAGPAKVVLGERLARSAAAEERPASAVFSLAVVALAGERIDRFDQRIPSRIDAARSGKSGEPIFELALAAAGRPDAAAWYLPLAGPLWKEKKYLMDYSGNRLSVRPGMQYSALLAIPSVSVNPGLSVFRK